LPLQYEKTYWITGYETAFIDGFFIFYHDLQRNDGFADLHNLSSAQQKHSKLHTNVHCYLHSELSVKQRMFDLVTLDRQTVLKLWQLHMNGNTA